MRSVCLPSAAPARNRRAHLLLALAVVSISAACAPDAPSATEPSFAAGDVTVHSSASDADAIVVTNATELVAALTPANAGRRIVVRSGDYGVTQLLNVPDGATLEGEGEMLFNASGLPTGFASGTRTTIRITANVPGDILTLGDGASVRGIAIEDLAGRAGNAIAVNSRSANDTLSAKISEVEITNPNAHAVIPSGPAGCGVTVLSQNLNLGAAPAAHAGAVIAATITRSLIHSTSTGTGCGLFAFNFAPLASISVNLSDNVIGGGLIANGGVSRPDAVHDSKTEIHSRANLYRDDSADPCVTRHLGWNMQGGSGVPAPLQIGEVARNTLSVHSQGDRLERFATAIVATGGRRFFGLPNSGPVNNNTMELELINAIISTPSCGSTDFRLSGAASGSASLNPGDGNVLRAVFRGVTGSGMRANVYADALGPASPLAQEFQGTGNLLEFAGNLRAFDKTNSAIDPAPAAEFFTAGR
jgi:hypothetical protein